jgi:hypothetical protein
MVDVSEIEPVTPACKDWSHEESTSYTGCDRPFTHRKETPVVAEPIPHHRCDKSENASSRSTIASRLKKLPGFAALLIHARR